MPSRRLCDVVEIIREVSNAGRGCEQVTTSVAPWADCNMAWAFRPCGAQLLSRSMPFRSCYRAEDGQLPNETLSREIVTSVLSLVELDFGVALAV